MLYSQKKLSLTILMKNLIRKVLNQWGYDIIKLPPTYLQTEVLAKKISPQSKILYGPFAGMLFHNKTWNYGSTIPRFVGCYEDELHPVIDYVCQQTYTDILDIGCADGYYAVGLAMQKPTTLVHAFDIDPQALALCKEVATMNHVTNIEYKNVCTSETLQHFDFKGRGFIVCDCEGYEAELFTADSIKNLANCDILIELHDMYVPELSEKMLPLFAQTHNLSIIPMQPRKESKYPILEQLDTQEKILAMTNGTRVLMEWAFLKSKNHQ